MHLYLFRHAQSQNNAFPEAQRVEDPPITEIGHQQARYLAEAVPALRLTHLVTSPFRRALQTTEHIRTTADLKPTVRTQLHEVGGCMRGPSVATMVGAPGLNRREIQAAYADYQVTDEIGPEGWWRSQPYETQEQAQQRAQNLLAATIKEFQGTDARVGYVMHADFKRILIKQLHDGLLDMPANASISQIVFTQDQARLNDYNNTEHLPKELVTC